MNAGDLTNEVDRKHAEREENRHCARTYKDRPVRFGDLNTQPMDRDGWRTKPAWTLEQLDKRVDG